MTGNDAILTLLGELRLRVAILEDENARLRAAAPDPAGVPLDPAEAAHQAMDS